MIDEKTTFILFKYTSADLSHGSHKKVLVVCDGCKKERLSPYYGYNDLCASCSQKGNKHPMFGKHHSEETKLKISNAAFGNKNSMFGKHHTEETKLKMSKTKTGKHHTEKAKLKMSKARIGTHLSEETKYKLSKNHADVSGDKNPNWKGGTKLAKARSSTKRRELFGFIPHNKTQKDFHGHHLDFNHVIFIPKELHTSIWHSVTKNINMDLINDVACDWYLKYQLNS